MKNNILEITDQDYCIKLNKELFDKTYVNQLLKRIRNEGRYANENLYTENETHFSNREIYERSIAINNLDDK